MGSNIDRLSETTAKVIRDSFQAQDADTYKQAVNKELDRLAKEGDISYEEYKAAQKFIKKESGLFEVLAARNRVEGNYNDYSMKGLEDLSDENANNLMKECGLSIDDLYSAINQFAGGDYTVTDSTTSIWKKMLFKTTKDSEIEAVRNFLNEQIEKNGNDKVLTKKETAVLMEGIGANVGHLSKIPKGLAIVLDILNPLGVGGMINVANDLNVSGGRSGLENKMSELNNKAYPKLDTES